MANYVLVSETGEVSSIECNSLEDLQREVGGLITSVWAGEELPQGTTVFANDEGILIGMQYNYVASFVVGHPLVGPVLFGGVVNDEGETLSITPKVESFIREMALYVGK